MNIKYYMNGVLKRTIADANPTAPMIVDFAINGNGKKIFDVKIANPSYTADVVQQTDYYPYGMVMPNRNGSDNSYRYGFQGQEKDDEVKGAGESVNYKYRMHDPRIGRFFSRDPLEKKYAWYSPYQFSGNKPIHAPELEGMESSREFVDDPNIRAMTPEQKNKYNSGSRIAGVVSLTLTVDFFITKGWLSKMFILHELGSEMNATDTYNEAKANGNYVQAEQSKQKMEEHGTNLAFALVFEGIFASIKLLPEVVVTSPTSVVKNSRNPYAPRRNIENNARTGKPRVDAEAEGKAHTQLGEKQSKSGAGTYPKRRTVDKDGNTRKEIDYTDHNRPKEHPNPHKHDWKKNNKGQYERGKATEL